MTEQMIRRLFDFHRFSPSNKLEALIQDTDSRQVSARTRRIISRHIAITITMAFIKERFFLSHDVLRFFHPGKCLLT